MRITNLFEIGSLQRKRRGRTSAGQRLVEFTLMLPILLMLLSGLIEFGFLLNTYLDVIDAAREAARFAANDDPTIALPSDLTPNFWNRAWLNSRGSLFTASDGRINWMPGWSDCAVLDHDLLDGEEPKSDIVISGFGFLNNTVKTRFPVGDDDGASNCGYQQSSLSTADINAKMDPSSVDNSGAVLVEIYYEYEWLLGLPWITMIAPDGIVLHAYTIMPNTYAEPDVVTLCHVATVQTISMDPADPSYPAHMAHGDYLGTCA